MNVVLRLDRFEESDINPIFGCSYDSSWPVLVLTNNMDYQMLVGSGNGSAYTVKISKAKCDYWQMAVGDFISFNEANSRNCILIMSEAELTAVQRVYEGHYFNEPALRKYESKVLIHSTTLENWDRIQMDGCLKSWNRLKSENADYEDKPIGAALGDPAEFSDYIMFGGGVTGEIVVNSKQKGKIVMDTAAEYLTGARLYFDFERIAADGLLIRDGVHVKVRDILPLKPYLLWAATWETVGLANRKSTPKKFAEMADTQFYKIRAIL